MALDPSTAESIKEWGLTLAALFGAGLAGWKGRARRESVVPHYTGPPDDQPRKITRKEWHDLVNHASTNGLKIAANEIRLDAMGLTVASLRGEFSAFSSIATKASESLARLEERFGAHVDRWEEGSERAMRDREEMMRRFDSLDRKLDGSGR